MVLLWHPLFLRVLVCQLLWFISSVQAVEVRHPGKNMNTLESCFLVEIEVIILIESNTDTVVLV